MPRLIEADKRRDWETVCDLVMLTPEIMSDGLKYVYDHLPDELRFTLPVECYTQNGDRMPVIRKYVRQARKYAPIELAKYRISWTTDLKVAQWFYDRALLCGQSPRHLYRGSIKPNQIIWYIDDREKREIMQYGSVHDISEIDR